MKSQEIIYRGIAEQCRAVQNGEQSIDNATNEILALFQSEPSKWISTKERREIKGGWYLCVNPNSQPADEYELAFYRNYTGMFIRDSGDVIHPSYYISLQDLPAPPTKQEGL